MIDWLSGQGALVWIAITLVAAATQTARNTVQRGLVKDLGTWGATLVRFLYGLPFAAILLALLLWKAPVWPTLTPRFWIMCALGALGQIMATGFLLSVMAERNFALGVAYSKTELIQIAAVSFILLGDPLSAGALIAVLLATLGVVLLAPPVGEGTIKPYVAGLTSRTALLGLACGLSFTFATVGYRGALLALSPTPRLLAAATSLTIALVMQTAALGLWLLAREPGIAGKLARLWRESLPAGFLGAFASYCWNLALSLTSATNVRTVGLVELFFGYLVSRRLLDETIPKREVIGAALIAAGVVVILWLG